MVVRIGADIVLLVAERHQSHHPNSGMAAVAGNDGARADLERLDFSQRHEQNCTAGVGNYTFSGLPFFVLVFGTVGAQENYARNSRAVTRLCD